MRKPELHLRFFLPLLLIFAWSEYRLLALRDMMGALPLDQQVTPELDAFYFCEG
jgi:hypothetical protein